MKFTELLEDTPRVPGLLTSGQTMLVANRLRLYVNYFGHSTQEERERESVELHSRGSRRVKEPSCSCQEVAAVVRPLQRCCLPLQYVCTFPVPGCLCG